MSIDIKRPLNSSPDMVKYADVIDVIAANPKCFSSEDKEERIMGDMLDIARKDFGSIEHRKEIAGFYELYEQEVLDLPKREFKTLVIGIIKGRLQGKFEASETIAFWTHREEDFKKILEEEINELKANEERNDDSTAEGGSDTEEKDTDSEQLQS